MSSFAPTTVVVRVPGKVNLQLSVGPRENDGFHNIVTVFQAISLFDEIAISQGVQGAGITFSITGDHTHGVPADATNLAARAAQLMIKKYDIPTDLQIEIKKSVPVAGGMAGGSADAAGTILALDALYCLGLSREDMQTIAKQLGSDVPFMLSGGTAVGRGPITGC